MEHRFVTDSKGRKVAVLLPIREYERLQDDLHDLAILVNRGEEETLPFKVLKKRLEQHRRGFLR